MNIKVMGGHRFEAGVGFVPYEPNHPLDEMEAFVNEHGVEVLAELGCGTPTSPAEINYLDGSGGLLGANIVLRGTNGDAIIEAYKDPDSGEWVVNDYGVKAEGVMATQMMVDVMREAGIEPKKE